MSTVNLAGEVKKVQIVRKESADSIKLAAQIIFEFEPTSKGIAELQDLIAMQELPVKVTITGQQIELPVAKAQ